MAVTSIEKFKASAIREVCIPGCSDGEEFTVEIKPMSMMTLLANGTIPNELMAQAKSLFNGKQPGEITMDDAEELVEELDTDALIAMAKLMDAVCEAVLYNPKYSDIEEYLTQEQKEAIFEYSQSGIKAVTPTNLK